jgi:hypothetical protein
MCVLLNVLGDGILVHKILKDFHEQFSATENDPVFEFGVVGEFVEVLVYTARTFDPFVIVVCDPVKDGHVVLEVCVRMPDLECLGRTFVRAVDGALVG